MQLLSISGIIWSVALSIDLSVNMHAIHLIWLVATVVQVMAVLWFIMVLRISTKQEKAQENK